MVGVNNRNLGTFHTDVANSYRLAALLPKPNYTPSVNVESLDESQVTLIVRAWTEIANYWNVLYDVNEQIYKQLPQHGVNFPFPQMDVHVKN